MKTIKFDATDMHKVDGELILTGPIAQMFEFLKELGLKVFAAAVRRQAVVRGQLIVWWDGYLCCEPTSA